MTNLSKSLKTLSLVGLACTAIISCGGGGGTPGTDTPVVGPLHR